MGTKQIRGGLGLGDSRESLMTGQSSRLISKIFGQNEYFQWQKAEVIEVDLNPDLPEFVGRIKFRLYSEKGKTEEALQYALPLMPYIRSYPVIHEIVAITEFDGKFYWLSTLNTLGLLNNNTQPNLTAVNSIQNDNTVNDYKTSQANGIPKSSAENEISYGENFKSNRFAVGPLSPEEGDLIFEGRFGQSIRLGNNRETNLPNIKISVRDLLEEYQIDKENLDDDSCIFITSDEMLSFTPIGVPISDVNNPPNEYNGKQIMITSDRLIFGAKLNEILMFSNKTISFASNDNFSVDTNKQFMLKAEQEAKFQALKIMIGNWNANEPLVLGNKWKDMMLLLIDILLNHIHPTGTGPSGPMMPPQQSDLRNLKSDVQNKKQLSDDNFTTKKNT